MNIRSALLSIVFLTVMTGASALERGAQIRVVGDGSQIMVLFDEKTQAEIGANYEALTLEMTGPMGYKKEFKFNSEETIAVFDKFMDGQYKLEIVAVPRVNPDAMKRLMRHRERGEMLEMEEKKLRFQKEGLLPTDEESANNRIYGGFRLVEGKLVDPAETEKELSNDK